MLLLSLLLIVVVVVVVLSVCLSACLPVCLSVCLSFYLSICLPVYLSVYLSACLPARLSINTSDPQGDTRVNEQPGLAAIHTVFARLHNDLARELDRLRPRDTDEEIFQETRKIVAAVIQNIHYSEWLPLILGRRTWREFGLQTGLRSQYVPSVDPRVTNAFSTAAFRFGHTLIPDSFQIGDR